MQVMGYNNLNSFVCWGSFCISLKYIASKCLHEGYQPENFGFTIVHFETDYSLSEVNAEGNENLKQSGFRVLEEKQMKVDGVKCYKAVYEISLQGQKVKHISYTFKKSDMLYNVKFGSVTTKTQETLAADIIDSFRFEL